MSNLRTEIRRSYDGGAIGCSMLGLLAVVALAAIGLLIAGLVYVVALAAHAGWIAGAS